jgi:hypothetical protein
VGKGALGAVPTILESNGFALNGGHAIGRAFARPVGFAHPTRSRISGLRCRGIPLVLRYIRTKGSRVWYAFTEGYRSNRELPRADFEAAHLFVPIRHIWLLGEWASRIPEWGSHAVPADWIAAQLDFMLSWEKEKLAPGLL